MTSDLAGTGPLLPTGYLAFQQPPNRTSPQPILQAPRARPRQSFTPTYRAPETLRDASEPPFKKRKLEDHARTGFGSPWREISGPTEIKHAASNKRTVPGSGASCLLGPDSKSNIKGKEQKSRQPTLCPKRSGKSSYAGGIQHGHSLAIERATARDVVEVKPYAPETPTFAPLIHRTGKSA